MPHHSGAELPGAQALRQMAAQSDSRGLFSDRAPDPAYAGLFLNRELSWLQFNRRVLAEAAGETLPGEDMRLSRKVWLRLSSSRRRSA